MRGSAKIWDTDIEGRIQVYIQASEQRWRLVFLEGEGHTYTIQELRARAPGREQEGPGLARMTRRGLGKWMD